MTSPTERKKLRELLSTNYFKNNNEIELAFEQIETDRCYFLTGEKINLSTYQPINLSTEILWAEKLSGWEGGLVVSKDELKETDITELKKIFGFNRIKNIVSGKEKYVEVALCDENSEVLSLGIIKEIDYKKEKIVLMTPIDKNLIPEVKIIQFGSLKLTFAGEENGFIEPGYL